MKWLWYGAGVLALFLGFVGALLPVMPTVPFVLLAAYCFARASPRLHHWLLTHRYFGPMIQDWNARRAVPRRAKIWATSALAISLPLSAYGLGWRWWGLSAAVVAISGAVLLWLWQLPDA